MSRSNLPVGVKTGDPEEGRSPRRTAAEPTEGGGADGCRPGADPGGRRADRNEGQAWGRHRNKNVYTLRRRPMSRTWQSLNNG